MKHKHSGFTLKLALFVTGCAGIVAEFVLSTLATYLLGNAVFQWTIVMSIMLFAMGAGSRISRYIDRDLIGMFILTELLLSVLCALSAVVGYSLASYTSDNTALVLYSQAFCIGTMIGLEIPLVTRINESYQELRVNISNVMEKDYFGALFGGIFFAFLALPYLGMTYTPIILGSINFTVALLVLFNYWNLIEKKITVMASSAIVVVLISGLFIYAKPVILYGEQKKYKDKIIYSSQSRYQKIVMTQWKKYYWLYLNGQEQFSTFDEELYHEPLVHPAMTVSADHSHVLILGGGDGLAAREVLKYPNVRSITLVDLDPDMTDLAKEHPVLRQINKESMNSPKLRILNLDAASFLEKDEKMYGVIIIDLPDPDSVDLMHVYSETFYNMAKRHLVKGGIIVAQATSPFFATKAFMCIRKTIASAGFSTVSYQNQIPTMGHWGWILGAKTEDIRNDRLLEVVRKLDFSNVETRSLNMGVMNAMTYFGKEITDKFDDSEIKINTELSPVLYRYYLEGTWGVY